MGVPKINSFQDHPELFHRDLLGRLLALRPGEALTLQSLLPKAETVSVPVQGLQVFMGSITKQVQTSGKRILGHLPLGHRRQSVDLFPQVRRPGAYKDPDRCPVKKHPTVPSPPGAPGEDVRGSPLAVRGSVQDC